MAYPTTFTYGPGNVDKILSTTLSLYRKEMRDNIFTAIPLFHWMYKKMKKTEQGGISIVIPIMYKKNGTGKFYSRYDMLDTTPQENFTSIQYKWKQLAGSITLSGFDLRVNNSKEAIVKLLTAETKNCESSLQDLLGQALFATSPATNDINSLVSLVDATSTVGDVNSTSSTWWQSNVVSSGSFAAQGLSDMRTLYNTLSKYNQKDHADVIVTTQTIFEYYENLVQVQQRINDNSLGDIGFETLKFKGTTMFWDEYCNSGVLYMLNTNHLELVVHSQADFNTTEFVKPANQDAKTAQILWMGELISDERRKQGKMTGITA